MHEILRQAGFFHLAVVFQAGLIDRIDRAGDDVSVETAQEQAAAVGEG